jgi:hypothetical protein
MRTYKKSMVAPKRNEKVNSLPVRQCPDLGFQRLIVLPFILQFGL